MRAAWLGAIATFALSGCASVSIDAAGAPDSARMQHRYENAYLHVEGAHLVAANGVKVSLHGINVGGWLVTEDWMCGIADDQDSDKISGVAGIAGRWAFDTLEARFGAAKAEALKNVWQDHWITAADLDEIHDGGFNLIRVPISYRTLQGADGNWTLDRRGRIDFSRMDWIVREAAKRGIYTIFDLHVWPDQRFDYQKIGRPEGRAIRDAMARLWTAIAAHYRGDGAIAAVDLINEFPGAWGVQPVLADAVRSGDPDRVEVVEGYTYAEFLKLRREGQFPNSVFSEHLYGKDPLTTEELTNRLSETKDSPVPVYVGEFLPADFSGATAAMALLDVSWSPWTYKTVDRENWGMFDYLHGPKTDLQQDSADAIALKWSVDLVAWQAPDASPGVVIDADRHLSSQYRPPLALP